MGDEEPAHSDSQFQLSLADLRGSLKWLIAGAGAAATVLLAGTQLKDVTASSPGLRVAGVAAGVTALLVAVILLVTATRVLATPRLSASELSNLENRNPEAPVVLRIRQQRVHLLGRATTVTELYTQYANAINTLQELDAGRSPTWQGAPLTGASGDRAKVTNAITATENRLATVEDAAQYFSTSLRFNRLVRWFPVAAGLFVASIGVFTFASLKPNVQSVPITGPVSVKLEVLDRAKSGLPMSCKATELTGVAIAGSLDSPTVVLTPQSGCAAATVTPNPGIVVVPVVVPAGGH